MAEQSITDRITYRPATPDDLDDIVRFVDYWLSGLARKEGLQEGGKDYFVPKGRHEGFITKDSHNVLIAIDTNHIVGWAVTTRKKSLIHLLISGEVRGQGIGKEMLHILDPDIVRSKIDQSTGDPSQFYLTQGYIDSELGLMGKHQNIRILKKPGVEISVKPTPEKPVEKEPEPAQPKTFARIIDQITTMFLPGREQPISQGRLDYSKD